MKDYNRGDMSPKVEDYSVEKSDFSQSYEQSDTLRYVERSDRQMKEDAKKIRNQGYNGRYGK